MFSLFRIIRLAGLLLAFWAISTLSLAADPESEVIRERVEALTAGFKARAGDQQLLAGQALVEFYRERQFSPAWFNARSLRPEALELLRMVDEVDQEGLRPDDYHRRLIDRLIQDSGDESTAAARADLDLLLSDAFLMLGSHLLAGKLNADTLIPEWRANRHELDMAPLLAQALETGSVAAILKTFRPTQPGYELLRQERQRMKSLTGAQGWPEIGRGPLIHPGNQDRRLSLIRERLITLGDYTPTESASSGDQYDTELLAAVSRFQARHGLEPDGVIGPATIRALNLSPRQRLQTIDANLERWRWLPERLGETHIMINPAANRLDLINNNSRVLTLDVELSETCLAIPFTREQIRYLVLNPAWTVSPTDPGYRKLARLRGEADFAELGFRLIRGWGESQKRREADAINWAALTADDPDFRLVQTPGPANALGQIKFMGDGSNRVFLHGLPSRGRFSREKEDVYGCIQVDGAFELGDELLGNKHGWSHRMARNGGAPRPATHVLPEPVKMYLLYLTAWGDGDGRLQVRTDPLRQDPVIVEALGQPAP